MNRLFCYLACFFALLQATAQNQPHNHWQLAGSVGYAISTQDKIILNKDLVVENDTVVGFIPSTFRYGTSTGFNIDAEAIYQKTSGWYYVLGMQSFISLPKVYFNVTDILYFPVENYGRSRETSGYAMFKLGIGYRTNYKRSANLFLGGNLMFGGGWWRRMGYPGYQDNVIYDNNLTFGMTFPLGLGASFEAGTLLRINRNVEGVIKTGFNVVGLSVWKNKDDLLKNNPNYSTGEFLKEWYNINFSIGIRYNL